jgi:hypothetical protein
VLLQATEDAKHYFTDVCDVGHIQMCDIALLYPSVR